MMGRLILGVWGYSLRIVKVGEEAYSRLQAEKKPLIILIWHGRIFLVPFYFRRQKLMPLISPSEDGEIAARIMGGWGYKILRGSSSHSIVTAWKKMKAELMQGGGVIIVPDGPRGPNRQMKEGALKLAQETGAFLVPVSFAAARGKYLSSWDRFFIPYPFSRTIVIYGSPFQVPPDLSEEELEKERQRIERLLVQLDKEAENYFKKNEKEVSGGSKGG